MFKALFFASLMMPMAVQACPSSCSESADCSGGCGSCTLDPFKSVSHGTCVDLLKLPESERSKLKVLSNDEYIKDGKVHKKNAH